MKYQVTMDVGNATLTFEVDTNRQSAKAIKWSGKQTDIETLHHEFEKICPNLRTFEECYLCI